MYKVINSFRDKEDNNTLYKVGEEFPKGDSKPSKKRIEQLSKTHPIYKSVFIQEVKEEKKTPKKRPPKGVKLDEHH